MKNNKHILAFLRPLSVALVLSLSVPVIANAEGSNSGGGEHGSGTGTSGNTIKPSAATSSHDSSTNNSAESANTDKIKSLVERFHGDTKDTIKDALRAKESDKLKEARQKVCENRKGSIDGRITRTENFAGSHKEKLDAIYAKVKAFHDSKNLTVANYDQLVAAVDAAQADAAAKVAALKAVNTTVDCSNQNVADGLSAYRAALSATRDSLKAYRSALVDLIKAVRQAAESSTGGSN